MRNLNKPNRYNVASIQAQQTLGGNVMESAENGLYVEWRDYKWLLDSYAFVRDQWKDLDSEVERLKFEIEVHRQGWNSEDIYNHECKLEVEKMRRASKEGKQS